MYAVCVYLTATPPTLYLAHSASSFNGIQHDEAVAQMDWWGLLYVQVQHQGVQTGLEQSRDNGVHVDESLPYPMSTAKSLSAIDAALIAKGIRCALQQRLQGSCTQLSCRRNLFRLRSSCTAQASRSKVRGSVPTIALCFPDSRAWTSLHEEGREAPQSCSFANGSQPIGTQPAGVASTCAQTHVCRQRNCICRACEDTVHAGSVVAMRVYITSVTDQEDASMSS